MDSTALRQLLEQQLPHGLAKDLVDEFLTIRQDVASGTLGRAAPGKFVETLVQVLQHLETGTFEKQPSVDSYLRGLESRQSGLDDGLRFCASRIGRAMYTLRNKRNIAHKGAVDPNTYDLAFVHHAAQWIMAELLRQLSGTSMTLAGTLIEQVQAPVGGFVEDFGGRRIVLSDVSIPEEIVLLLHSYHPVPVTRAAVMEALHRRSAGAVRKALSQLWTAKEIEWPQKDECKLTRRGLERAAEIVCRLLA